MSIHPQTKLWRILSTEAHRAENLLLTAVLPPKRIHASHDLISLLHLDSLYNTYVRPFADAIGPEEDGVKDEAGDGMQIDGEGDIPSGAGGKKRKKAKKAKLEKGYIHLIDDCIGEPYPASQLSLY